MSRSLRRALITAALPFCVMVVTGAAGPPEAAGPRVGQVIGVGSFVHGVETLEQSLEYYRDVLGFEPIGTVPPAPIFDLPIQTLTNHGGALHRTVTLKIPDSTVKLQLFEVTNGQPGTRSSLRQTTARPTDPGGAVLGVRVPSVATTFANIERSHQADVLGVGGKPAGNVLFARNRDGAVTELVQSDGNGTADAASIVLTTAGDGLTIKFFKDVLGFDLETGDWESGKDVMNAVGADTGMIRRTAGVVPGTKVRFEIDEYSGIPQKRAYYYYNSIPGAVSLQFVVRDIDEMVKILRAEQVRIVTTGQQPVTIDHSRTVLVRDPDGLFIQLMEREQD